MTALKKTIIRTGLETLYFSGAYQVLRPFVSGVGAIVTLHHVRPPRPELFQPNRLLEVTPQSYRIRKRILNTEDRGKMSKKAKEQLEEG